jgi:hypothetical protein
MIFYIKKNNKIINRRNFQEGKKFLFDFKMEMEQLNLFSNIFFIIRFIVYEISIRLILISEYLI